MATNGIYDEIKIDETLNSTNSITKEDWEIDTAFNWKAQNSLEAGNVSGSGSKIQKIRFKRRKIGDLKWQTMLDIDYDLDIENYDLLDYLIENSTDYEYALVPILQGFEGVGVTKKITPKYFSMFLTGRDTNGELKNYPLRFDLKTNDIKVNEDKVYQKTLSSKYPALLCGESKYLTGNINVKLISPITESEDGRIDIKAEKVYREAFEDFIHSGKPMLIRNHSLYVLGTIGEPSKNPAFEEEVAFGLYDYSLIFTECGDAKDMATLQNNNLTYEINKN
jgi:hypothetical protein